MSKTFIFSLLLIAICPAFSQTILQPLSIGKKMPVKAVKATEYFTGATRSISLNNPGKKLTILAFWATWCDSSVAIIPVLENLQKQFDKQVQILLVNTEEDRSAAMFMDNRRRVQRLNLDIAWISQDTILERLFPYRSLPYFIWLDDKGIVRQLTGLSPLTAPDISAVLKDYSHTLPQKQNDQFPLLYNKPLFAAGNGGNGEHIRCNSVLSKRIEGAMTGSVVQTSDEDGYGILVMNYPIAELYQVAYNEDTARELMSLSFPSFRTIYKMKDTSKIVVWVNGEYIKENTYTYELIGPKKIQELRKIMREDLQRYFGLGVRRIPKKMWVWVLRSSSPDLLRSKGGRDTFEIYPAGGIKLKNQPAGWISRNFYDDLYHWPLIDDTHLTGNIDIDFKADLTDPASINKALTPYGMSLTFEERIVNCLELSDPSQ